MTTTDEGLLRLGLNRNPFPPSTTGTAFVDDLSLPDQWEADLRLRIQQLAESDGDKALLIEGGYGSGKTFILNWIQTKVLPEYRVKPFFFENPGVAFYDLANRLMRQVGRYELSKALWEMLYRPDDAQEVQTRMFEPEFGPWLQTLDNRRLRNRAISRLSDAIKDQGLATDEEIRTKIARLIVETGERPYFEYRDFVPRSSRSLVAEQEEPRYFQALVRLLENVLDAGGIAFLLDEFEDVALGRRLNRTQAASYTTTLRRLLDVAEEEELWIILSTTPEGLRRTAEVDESLLERFSSRYRIPELTEDDAYAIVTRRLQSARVDDRKGLSPFAENALSGLVETNRSSPRRLTKIMWYALAAAAERGESAPLSVDLVNEAEAQMYPDPSEA